MSAKDDAEAYLGRIFFEPKTEPGAPKDRPLRTAAEIAMQRASASVVSLELKKAETEIQKASRKLHEITHGTNRPNCSLDKNNVIKAKINTLLDHVDRANRHLLVAIKRPKASVQTGAYVIVDPTNSYVAADENTKAIVQRLQHASKQVMDSLLEWAVGNTELPELCDNPSRLAPKYVGLSRRRAQRTPTQMIPGRVVERLGH